MPSKYMLNSAIEYGGHTSEFERSTLSGKGREEGPGSPPERDALSLAGSQAGPGLAALSGPTVRGARDSDLMSDQMSESPSLKCTVCPDQL